MSLIRVRHRRKKAFIDVHGGMSMGRLLALLIAVLALVWYLGWRF
jgi:hypothetical protein